MLGGVVQPIMWSLQTQVGVELRLGCDNIFAKRRDPSGNNIPKINQVFAFLYNFWMNIYHILLKIFKLEGLNFVWPLNILS